eukprot:7240362-Pyramimonas_sp.AAC.1
MEGLVQTPRMLAVLARIQARELARGRTPQAPDGHSSLQQPGTVAPEPQEEVELESDSSD